MSIAGRGGEVNLYGGCAPDTVVTLATGSLHYEALRIQGSYHHTPDTVRAALQLLLAGSAPFAELIGAPIGLEDVADTLAASGVKRPVVP